MSWQPELDELRRRQAMTKEMGGADKVKRQHDGGRLTVRERIERLVDKDSFREIGSIAGKADYDGKQRPGAPDAGQRRDGPRRRSTAGTSR